MCMLNGFPDSSGWSSRGSRESKKKKKSVHACNRSFFTLMRWYKVGTLNHLLHCCQSQFMSHNALLLWFLKVIINIVVLCQVKRPYFSLILYVFFNLQQTVLFLAICYLSCIYFYILLLLIILQSVSEFKLHVIAFYNFVSQSVLPVTRTLPMSCKFWKTWLFWQVWNQSTNWACFGNIVYAQYVVNGIKLCVWSLNVQPDPLLIEKPLALEQWRECKLLSSSLLKSLEKCIFLYKCTFLMRVEYEISWCSLHTAVYLALNMYVLASCMCKCV